MPLKSSDTPTFKDFLESETGQQCTHTDLMKETSRDKFQDYLIARLRDAYDKGQEDGHYWANTIINELELQIHQLKDRN